MKLLKDFREFTLRGNVLDLAVGIVIGAAFGSIVTAVVDNILMPIIGILTGGVDFKSLAVKVGNAELKYGLFIQATVTFLIIAFFLFLVVKAANAVRLKTPVAPPNSTDQLLMKISGQLDSFHKEISRKRPPGQEDKKDQLMLEQ
ncbi:MAG TPA: large conductance mechanosensitive channel protein MscL [Flavisolibacter sp.]|nr:large conductance mechanosensitive channel protein MscL [Flavisolibacter sp.]